MSSITQFTSLKVVLLLSLLITLIMASSDAYTFQLQDSGYNEPDGGEPLRIEAAKQWAQSLDDPTSIKELIIVTYMEPHINFKNTKDRSETLITVDWSQNRMVAEMKQYRGDWRGHLDKIFVRIVAGTNDRVESMDEAAKGEQLAALFEGFRGTHMYLG